MTNTRPQRNSQEEKREGGGEGKENEVWGKRGKGEFLKDDGEEKLCAYIPFSSCIFVMERREEEDKGGGR